MAGGEFPGDGLASAMLLEVAPDASVAWAVRVGSVWDTGHAFAGSSITEPIFDLASLTKPMTAVAVARAGIDRTARLGDFVAEAVGTPAADATLELLLSHRAGMPPDGAFHEPILSGAQDRSAALRAMAELRDRGTSAPIYSDLGYILVGVALARATGARDAGEAIERLVVAPLVDAGGPIDLGTARRLKSEPVEFDRRVRKTEVVSFRGGAIDGEVHDENAWALTGLGGSGHAGMFGTAPAVLAFGCAVLDALAGRGGAFGRSTDLGWLVAERPGGTLRAGFDGKSGEGSSAGAVCGPRTFGHLGFTGTSLWIDPDAEAVTVFLTNRVHPTRENQKIRTARPKVHDALFSIAAGRRRA